MEIIRKSMRQCRVDKGIVREKKLWRGKIRTAKITKWDEGKDKKVDCTL